MVLLTRLAKVVYRRCGEELLGMRLRQFVTLSYLRDHEVVTQQAVGEALALDPNSLVLLLNELEEAGFVQRRRDPADRRRHLVDLTEAGREALAAGERAQESIEDEVLAPLSPEERATLRSLLTRTLRGDGEAAEPRADAVVAEVR